MGMRNRRALDGGTGGQEIGGHFADLEIVDILAAIYEDVTASYDQSLHITARREFPDKQLRLPFPTTISSGKVQVANIHFGVSHLISSLNVPVTLDSK